MKKDRLFLLFSLILFFYLYSICFRSLPTFFNLDICCAEKNEKQRGMNKRQKRKVPATIFFLLVYFIFRFFFFFLHCSKRRWKSREGLGFGVHFLRIWEARITSGFVIIWISVFPFSLFRLALFYTCLHTFSFSSFCPTHPSSSSSSLVLFCFIIPTSSAVTAVEYI